MNPPARPQPNPFPGLRPFRSDEHHLFFGREEQTAALLQLLRKHRFLAVVGTSGSGKSSLVRAGMIAELHGGTMTRAGSTWEVIILRPGGSPIENLARAFVDADLYDADDPNTLPRLLATLNRSRFGLVEAVKQCDLFSPGTNLLVVVDQFEELFRFRQQGVNSEEAAAAFVNLLLTASELAECPIYVAITMRSDYLGDCSEIPGLAEAVNAGEYLIPRLLRDQKRDAIEKPIGVGGGKISPLLVQRLLNDVGDDPDQLPVLQHALMRMWEVWSAGSDHGRPIDFCDFEATGGLAAALSNHADEIYDALPDDRHRRACERVFKTLTEKGKDNRGIRRPTRLAQLMAIAGEDYRTVTAVLDAFRQGGVTFLMPGTDQELDARTVVDLSHESLMRGWQQLRGWVEDEAQSARIFRRLSDTASLWRSGKAGLFRDPDLQIALTWREQLRPNTEWAEQYGGNFDAAIEFLERSNADAEAAQRVQEAARERELEQAQQLAESRQQRIEQQQRSTRRLRSMLAGLAVVAAIAVGASLVAFNFWRDADLARQAAQRSEQSANENAQTARENAEAAQREAERAAAHEAIAREARDEAEIRAYTASLAAAAADLQRNDSRTLRRRLEQAPERMRGWEWAYLWNESDRSLQTILTLPPENNGYLMDISRDGKLVAVRAAGGHDKPVTVYDTRTGAQVAVLTTYSSSAPLMTFSADNKLLAYHHHGTPGVQIYEIQTGRGLAPNPHEFRAFLGFDPAGERAVMLDERGKLRIFKTAGWSVVAELPGTVPAGDYRRRGAVSSDGKRLVVGAFASDPMRIFDLSSNILLKEIPDTDTAVAVQFDDKGESVTTVSAAGVIVEYAAPDWKKVAETLEGRQQRGALAVHRLDGQLLRLSFDSTGAVVLYDGGLIRSAILRGQGAAGASIAVDAELNQIVTAHRDGVVSRWDLRHPRELRFGSRELAFTADGSAVYAGLQSSTGNGALQLCEVNATSGGIQGFLRWYPWSVAHGSEATQLAYSPDGRRVAVSTASGWGQGRWRIYDLWTGRAEHEAFPPKYGDLECIDWSADRRWIAVGGKTYGQNAGFVCLYDADTHQLLAELDGGAGGVHDVTFSRDSQRLATAGEDGTLRLWDVSGGRLLTTIGKAGDSAVSCVTYSPDGRYVVAGLADGTIGAWNPTSGDSLFRSQVHGAAVTCLAFAPDGTRLLTAADDHSLKVFDPAAWRELLTLHLEASARAMSFSPDGKRLALAAGSLVWLETEAETVRAIQRRLAREDGDRATPLVKDVLEKTADPLQARDQIIAQTAADAALRRAALGRLRISLDSQWKEAYQVEKLDGQLDLQILRKQVQFRQDQRATPEQKNELIGAINAATNLQAIQRQALVEFTSAVLNWPLSTSTENLAWGIVLNSGRSPDDQLLAYFGMGPILRQRPHDAGCLKTMALAEYRVGLYADALESAKLGAALSPHADGSAAHHLAVIAMSQHQMGQAGAAVETMRKLDELMKQPPASADQEAIALSNEARKVLAAPIEKAWEEQAAWDSCKTRLEQLVGESSSAIWQAWSLDRNARRHLERGDYEQAKAAWEQARTLLEARLAMSPDDAELAQGLASLLLSDLAQLVLNEHANENSTRWTILQPTEMKSEKGATLMRQDDGSILASGTNTESDVYRLSAVAKLDRIAAVRLEVLPDASLPNKGPGRHESGNFHLRAFRLYQSPGDGEHGLGPLPVERAWASFDYKAADADIAGTVNESLRKFWHVWGRFGEAHQAVFILREPASGKDRPFVIELSNGLNLGRFRLSVSGDWAALEHEEKRLKAMKITDPWAKLAAAYILGGGSERAADLLAKSKEKNGIVASLESWCLTAEFLDLLQARDPDSYPTLLAGAASAAAERGQLDQSRSLYERLVMLQPENALWKARTEQLKPGLFAVWNFDTGLAQWGAAHHCELSVQDGVLTARTTGDDPFFLTPVSLTPVSGPTGGTALVLRYRTDEAFTMQLFWADSSGSMDESRHRDYPIPASAGAWRDIILPFSCQGTLNTLRLDPNTANEHPLEIDSIVLRSLEPAEVALQLVQQKPDDSLVWLRIAPVLALAEDQAAYSEFCGHMAQQFAESKLPEVAERVVKACLVRANSIDLAKLPGDRLARMLDEGTAPDWLLTWGWCARALWAYRSGDAQSAVKHVAKSEECKPAETAHALNLAVLAMAQHQLRHPEEARRALDETSQLINRLQADDKIKGDHDLLIAQVLFREAEALINGKTKP